jgi:hypothetical protein
VSRQQRLTLVATIRRDAEPLLAGALMILGGIAAGVGIRNPRRLGLAAHG